MRRGHEQRRRVEKRIETIRIQGERRRGKGGRQQNNRNDKCRPKTGRTSVIHLTFLLTKFPLIQSELYTV